jgi:4,5-dihydroxyphthalate decarboxylase
VALETVQWVQAGTNEPGRTEGVAVSVPAGVSLTAMPERTLNELLLAGEIDALIAAHPPEEFKRGGGRIVRLFSDHRAVEERYYEQTGVFPIMHVVALGAELHARHPWVAMNLLSALAAAKARSIERALDVNAPSLPVPWGPANAQRAQELIGADFWPYGIEPNRRTLEAFVGFAHEQGVCARPLEIEELFVPEVKEAFRI